MFSVFHLLPKEFFPFFCYRIFSRVSLHNIERFPHFHGVHPSSRGSPVFFTLSIQSNSSELTTSRHIVDISTSPRVVDCPAVRLLPVSLSHFLLIFLPTITRGHPRVSTGDKALPDHPPPPPSRWHTEGDGNVRSLSGACRCEKTTTGETSQHGGEGTLRLPAFTFLIRVSSQFELARVPSSEYLMWFSRDN